MNEALLSLVQSPATGARLQPASMELVGKINNAVAGEQVCNLAGDLVTSPIESGLVDLESKCLFPVREGIAILVNEQAIPLSGFCESAGT